MKQKKQKLFITILLVGIIAITMLGLNSSIFASEENVAKVGSTEFATLNEAIAEAVETGGEITLLNDVNMASGIEITKDITINLNGKTITAPTKVFYVKAGTFTLKGNGEVKETTPYYAPIMVLGSTNENDNNYVTINVENGVSLEGWAGIFINNNGGCAYGVTINFNGEINSVRDSDNETGHGIYINGSINKQNNYPVINIGQSAKITSEGTGIYAAGYAKWNISGGIINAGEVGMEIRAGEVEIAGGNITATHIPTEVNANGNGSTTEGAAVAIAQHTTKLPINVKISGGKFTAFTPLYQSNPENNSTEDIAKIKLAVTGGTFNTISTSANEPTPENSVYSENFTKFIKGGTYSIEPNYTYLEDGYTYYENGNSVVVAEEATMTIESEAIVLKVGESADLGIKVSNNAVKDYVRIEKLTDDEAKELEQFEEYKDAFNAKGFALNGQTITANEAGATVLEVGLGGMGGQILVFAYEVKPDDKSSKTENEISEILSNAILEAMESEEEVTELLGLTEEELKKIGEALFAGKTITTEISINENKEPSNTEVKKIEEKLSDGAKIATYYEIDVLINADGEEIGKIKDLGKKIELELIVPSNITEVKEGFTRTYSIIRIHNGTAEIVAKGLVAKDGKINFGTDKFSTYALAYTDTATASKPTDETTNTAEEAKTTESTSNTSNPKTGDSIVKTFILFTVSLIGIVLIVKKMKH